MPKKKNSEEKEEKIPKLKPVEVEESDLEEKIEKEIEDSNSEQFQDFIEPSQAFASRGFDPTLNKTENLQSTPEQTLEEQAESSPTGKTGQEEKEEDYVVRYEDSRTDLYDDSQELQRMRESRGMVVSASERIAIDSPQTQNSRWQERTIDVNPQLREMEGNRKNSERDYVAKAQSRDRDETQNPWEQERKYQGKRL